jgi:hypothetical protein
VNEAQYVHLHTMHHSTVHQQTFLTFLGNSEELLELISLLSGTIPKPAMLEALATWQSRVSCYS